MRSKKVTKVILLESAEIDFQLFAEYYETQQPGLGERFIIEFTNQLEYVKQFPSSLSIQVQKIQGCTSSCISMYNCLQSDSCFNSRTCSYA